MAVAGGATTAFECRVVDGELLIRARTVLRSLCVSPVEAVATLATGSAVTVAGSDMVTLRAMLGVRGLRPDEGEREEK